MIAAVPRSVRNANPGNLRVGANWRGLRSPFNMTPPQEAEHEFCVFENAKWGFRALGLLLVNYAHDGCDTLREIVGRFAPSSENDTAAYVDCLCRDTGYGPDVALNLDDRATLATLCKAITIHETGAWAPWWHDADLLAGLEAMGRT